MDFDVDIQPKLEILIRKTNFDGWRQAARALVLDGIKPEDVMWSIKDEGELFAPGERPLQPPSSTVTFSVSARFVDLAKIAILHRDPRRFAMLYRLLWRLREHHDLLEIAADPDVISVTVMAKAVRRDEHRMHVSVRFREIGRERDAHYVAWFEPEHHIVELAAPFFASRFADMPWSILTPELCAHWDGFAISFTSGVSEAMTPTSDRLEETWWRYYATILNPARLKVKPVQRDRLFGPSIKWSKLNDDPSVCHVSYKILVDRQSQLPPRLKDFLQAISTRSTGFLDTNGDNAASVT